MSQEVERLLGFLPLLQMGKPIGNHRANQADIKKTRFLKKKGSKKSL